MTALPVKQLIPTDQALLFVQEVRDRCTIVALDEAEHYRTIAQTAEAGFSSGRIYDAFLLRCAAKVKAEKIYTWKLKHFRSINPHLFRPHPHALAATGSDGVVAFPRYF